MPEILVVLLIAALVGIGYAYWRQRADFESRAAVLVEVEKARLAQELRAKESALHELEVSLKQKTQEIDRLSAAANEYQQTHGYQLALALTLANSAYDALLVIDQQCRVIATNTAAETLFNIQQHSNQKLADLTHAPTLEMMVEDVLANEEEILEEQITINERIYLVRAQVIRRDGHVFIGLALQDITQLIRLNRARRDMVANISHELRTPIANIRLIIDGLFHDQDKPKRKDSISSLRAIARETDALLWLVQEMADLSMIESGQAIVRMVEVPLTEVVNDAIDRLADQMAAKQLKVVRHIPDKIQVLCDRDLMQRVVMNLIHNAIKWSPVGEAVTISAVSDDEEAVVSVFDNGPGVPDDQVDRIFERFYQLDASRSGGEGTGLGLAICKHIVVAHGGRIWAEGNSKGAGGRFKFTLLTAETSPETPGYYASSNGAVS
jgi:two-component system, OmpR family, phosphate regulon sensor histidine kinase PhoR